jgi:hypothetical protein
MPLPNSTAVRVMRVYPSRHNLAREHHQERAVRTQRSWHCLCHACSPEETLRWHPQRRQRRSSAHVPKNCRALSIFLGRQVKCVRSRKNMGEAQRRAVLMEDNHASKQTNQNWVELHLVPGLAVTYPALGGSFSCVVAPGCIAIGVDIFCKLCCRAMSFRDPKRCNF